MLKIYKASAGSGKTHAIVVEYLTIALDNPNYFKNILAVTFTNKATQQMKQRIIESLSDIANGTITPIALDIIENKRWSHETIIKKSKQLLTNILHNYSNFSVTTIDSFFQTVLKSFIKELGLGYNLKIELDSQQIVEEVIDKMLFESETNKDLKKWLLKFIEYKINSGKKWDIKKGLMIMCSQLSTELFKKHEKDILDFLKNKKNIKEYEIKIDKIINDFENNLKSIGKESLNLIKRSNLTIDDFAFGERGPMGYFKNIVEKNKFEPTNRAIEALTSIEKWYNKKSTNKGKIGVIVNEKLKSNLEHAIEIYKGSHKEYYNAINTKKLSYTLYISLYMIKALKDYKKENDIIFISDITQVIKEIINNNPTPFIYEKIGNFYKNFFIDEFQDISKLQWRNFMPLIQTGISESQNSIIVGDAKQSIYRWRGANSYIFLQEVEKDIGTNNVAVKYLNKSWRSSVELLSFNNIFFKNAINQLSAHLLVTDNHEEKEIISKYLGNELKAYEKFELHSNIVNNGKVKIKIINDNGNDWKDEAIKYTIKKIEKLQIKDNIEPHDICILVRNNNESREILKAIHNYQIFEETKNNCVYNVISTEAIDIKNISWIKIIINAIKIIINVITETDLIELAYLYQTYIKGNSVNKMAIITKSIKAHDLLPKELIEYKNELGHITIYSLIKYIEQIFNLNSIDIAKPFLTRLEDIAISYQSQYTNNLFNFIKWWEEGKTNDQQVIKLEQQKNNINIMTIHQSKGLEFKAVIIPFCNWSLDHNSSNTNILWCKNKIEQKLNIAVPIIYGKELNKSDYKKYYYKEKIKSYIDNLNLLYVAFTRAKKYMYIVAPETKVTNTTTIADLINHFHYGVEGDGN